MCDEVIDDKTYAKQLENRCATLSRFNKHREDIRKCIPITESVYHLQTLIVNHFGMFDLDKTYCGPGWWGDKIVPDLMFKFAGYIHDAIYLLIELGILDKKKWKPIADKIFLEIMLKYCYTFIGRGIARIYYYSVVKFGNPKVRK